jgi:hypothetical protein
VAPGADYTGNFGDGALTLVNTALTSNRGMGNYVFNSTILNLMVMPDVMAGTYENTLTLTVS